MTAPAAQPVVDAWPSQRRWLWVLLLTFTCYAYGGGYVRALVRPGEQLADFFQEWASARNHFTGLPIYESQRRTAELYLDYVPPQGSFFLEINAHPPTSVLLALPFGRLHYGPAFWIWNWLSVAALIVSLGLIAQGLRFRPTGWAVVPVVVLLLGNPLLQTLAYGQLGLFLMLLITGAWYAQRHGRSYAAGALLGAAAAIKLFPAFVFLYFLVRRDWRAIASGVATGLVLLAVTVGVLGVDTLRSYVVDAMPQVNAFRGQWGNASLAGFWFRLFDGSTGRSIPLVDLPWLARGAWLASSLVVVAALVSFIRRSRTRDDRDLAFGLTLIGMLLVSPITWDHYYLLLAQPIVMIVRRCREPGLAKALVLTSLLVMWVNPFSLWVFFLGATRDNLFSLQATPLQNITTVALPCYALLAVFGVGLVAAQRMLRRADESVPDVESARVKPADSDGFAQPQLA